MRIVSLTPSHTEILFYLGLGEKVVGVTVHCDYPEQAIFKKKVGTFASPDIKTVLSLKPDLVIAGSIHQDIIRELENNRVCVYKFEPSTIKELINGIKKIYSLTGKESFAYSKIYILEERLMTIIKTPKVINKHKLMFLMDGEYKLAIPGPSSYQYDALRMVGAQLMPVDKYKSYVFISWHDVASYNPTMILTCGRSKNEPLKKRCFGCTIKKRPCLREVNDIKKNPIIKNVDAIINGHVYTIPCHCLCRPGPRLFDGMERILELMN